MYAMNQSEYYAEQYFTPVVGALYDVLCVIDGKKTVLQVEFTDEPVYEEAMMGFDSFECWDTDENRYIYYCDKSGNHYMTTKNINEDTVQYKVVSIRKRN